MGINHVCNHRLVLAYISLVGLPLLVLLGALKAGSNLVAPPAVGGEWTIRWEQNQEPNSCVDLLYSSRQPALHISQSGTSLAIHLNSGRMTTFSGAMQAGHLTGSARLVGLAATCGDVRIEAEIIKKTDGRLLQGRFLFSKCVSCSPVPFRAGRHKLEDGGRHA
jgi:hypothetical protein